jgi:cystathionine beta-lyase family protein involved in aluminum resistance
MSSNSQHFGTPFYMQDKYTMRIVQGALIDPQFLDQFDAKVIEKFDNKDWDGLLEVSVTLDEVKAIQKQMIKHFRDPIPWYMDGYETNNRDKIIVAFGADDGEGGRVFTFDREDKKSFQKVADYAKSKGIPDEQIDFLEQ